MNPISAIKIFNMRLMPHFMQLFWLTLSGLHISNAKHEGDYEVRTTFILIFVLELGIGYRFIYFLSYQSKTIEQCQSEAGRCCCVVGVR